MAPASKQTPVPAPQHPVAQQAADLLWKFQLRKEHDQLLAKLNTHQEQLSTFVSDTRRNCEKLYSRLNAVEKKVDKLEADDRKLGQDSNKLHDELQALKEKVGSISNNAEKQGKGYSTSNIMNAGSAAEKASTSHQQMRPSSTGPDLFPRVSSHGTEDSVTPPREAAIAPDPEQLEHIRQGTSTLEEYLLMTDRIIADLPPKPTLTRTEDGFVKRFIIGLRNDKERVTLIKTLQQKDLWTIIPSSSGKKDILIRWSDFKEAVKRSKLLETTNNMESGAVSKEVEAGKRLQDVAAIGNVTEVTKKQEKGQKQQKKKRTLLWDD